MEITKKQIVGIGIGVGVVGLITAVGYYYCNRKTDELGYDEIEQVRLPKMKASRWRNIDEKYEELNDLDDRNRRRSRFTIYSKAGDMIEKRFKVLETDESGTKRGTERFRVSGERYIRTPSGYNQNNRNPTLKDLIIP